MRIVSKYRPRRYFMSFHTRKQRWAMLVAHRRAGKTVAAINDLIEKASYNTREAPQYAYIAPLLKQAKAIAWKYLKAFAAPYSPKINESELYVELSALPNSPRITIFGADNPDSFRGMYFDGVVLDEYGNMRESVWKEVLLPALIDRRGWAVFMGTPNGPNHFRDSFYAAKKDPSYHVSFLPVTETQVISEEDLAEMRRLMDPEQYAQEMLCNFEASVRGAIYARQLEVAQQQGRVGTFSFDRSIPVNVIFDLGWNDQTVCGFQQTRPDGLLMGHAYGERMKPISHYIEYIGEYWTQNRLKPGQIWLPHDARAKSLQTGKSIVEQFRPRYRPKIVPNLDLWDGIDALREGFANWYINEPECETFVLALKTYHRKYDEDLKAYSDEPVHDWSSDWMDMFRYANLVSNKPKEKSDFTPAGRSIAVPPGGGVHYGFNLNDIWDLVPNTSPRRPYG